MGPYLYLILSSACSLAIVHLLKLTEHRNLRTLNTLTMNYLVAFGIAAVSTTAGMDSFVDINGLSILSTLFMVVVGGIFILNFLVYSKSVDTNGLGTSVTAMRLSLVIPVAVSVVYYQEYLNLVKVIGLILVFVSLVLLVPRKRSIKFRNIDAGWLLIIIFLLSGFADLSLKIYQEDLSLDLSKTGFMAIVFLTAFFLGLGAVIIRKNGPLITKKEAFIGGLIGIPNLYSSIFLIHALEGIDGSIAYPVVNTLNIVGSTFLGIWAWRDTVHRLQWLGMIIAILAIVLLV